ncbi:MAG TPA: DUF2894 domain-containing protein [Burkholderiaceae bacterium]|nr:DUF2894 domain-containing protein [Burkholderiaceae bacterium]
MIGNDPARVVEREPTIASLRACGADRFDPVGFRFIEALSERASACPSTIRPLLEGRLARAMTDYLERFERARTEAREALAGAGERFPEAATALRQRGDNGDFGGLRQLLARLEARGRSSPLAALLDEIGRHSPDDELRSVERFRATWSRLAVERRLSRSFAQAPENAGPLNSEHLVLRSLGLMRDTSPDYLASFMSWVDALFWLEQLAADPVAAGTLPAQESAARRKRRPPSQTPLPRRSRP